MILCILIEPVQCSVEKAKQRFFWWFFSFPFPSLLAQVNSQLKQTKIILFDFFDLFSIFNFNFSPRIAQVCDRLKQTNLRQDLEQLQSSMARLSNFYIRRCHHVSLILDDFFSFPVLMLMVRYERTNMTQNVTQLRERYKAIQEMIADAQRSQDHICWGCHW